MAGRVTFKSVLKDLKETKTPFVIAGGGDEKIGFQLLNGNGEAIEGGSFLTKNIGAIPSKVVEVVRAINPTGEFTKRYADVGSNAEQAETAEA